MKTRGKEIGRCGDDYFLGENDDEKKRGKETTEQQEIEVRTQFLDSGYDERLRDSHSWLPQSSGSRGKK
jgi:hypothetical protein